MCDINLRDELFPLFVKENKNDTYTDTKTEMLIKRPYENSCLLSVKRFSKNIFFLKH